MSDFLGNLRTSVGLFCLDGLGDAEGDTLSSLLLNKAIFWLKDILQSSLGGQCESPS